MQLGLRITIEMLRDYEKYQEIEITFFLLFRALWTLLHCLPALVVAVEKSDSSPFFNPL